MNSLLPHLPSDATRIQADKICDYIPIISNMTNFIDLLEKAVYHLKTDQEKEHKPLESYKAHVQDKSKLRCTILLFLPVVGNLLVGIYDYVNYRNEPKISSEPEIKEKTLSSEIDELIFTKYLEPIRTKKEDSKEIIIFLLEKMQIKYDFEFKKAVPGVARNDLNTFYENRLGIISINMYEPLKTDIEFLKECITANELFMLTQRYKEFSKELWEHKEKTWGGPRRIYS